MKVSILIPCFNAEQWIANAIESALGQTWQDFEVIVVDDGSTDRSADVIRTYGSKVRIESGPNRGGNGARNELLRLAHGEWVQYLDADDYLLPEKIARQVAFSRSDPEADVIYGPVTLEHWSESGATRELLPIPEPHDPWILLARWYLPQTGAPLFRRQAILDVGGWKEDQAACQEHELYLRLLMARKKFSYCASSGAVYRQWGEHTVCKRDKPLTRRLRLEIEERIENFLRSQNELTTARRWAINQARFELARMEWLNDPNEAAAIIRTIDRSDSTFIPGGAAAPPLYRHAYRLFGFLRAERLARWRRAMTRP